MAATLPGPPKEDSGAAPRGLARGQHQQRPIHQQAASRSGPFRPEAVGGTILIGTASAAGSPVSGLSRRRLGEDGSGWRPACESRRGDIPRSEGR